MKYCRICKVHAASNSGNCPLCGSYLQETPEGVNPPTQFEREIEPLVEFLPADVRDPADFFRTKTSKLLFFATLVCVVLNLLISRESLWSLYVVAGCIFTIFCVLMPIFRRSKVYTQILVDVPVVTVLTVLLELLITDFKSYDFSLRFLLPIIYGAVIVLIDFMIIFVAKSGKTTGYFSVLLLPTVLALIPQIVVWATSFLTISLGKSLAAFIVFFFALLNFGIVFIVCYKRLREEYLCKWQI